MKAVAEESTRNPPAKSKISNCNMNRNGYTSNNCINNGCTKFLLLLRQPLLLLIVKTVKVPELMGFREKEANSDKFNFIWGIKATGYKKAHVTNDRFSTIFREHLHNKSWKYKLTRCHTLFEEKPETSSTVSTTSCSHLYTTFS